MNPDTFICPFCDSELKQVKVSLRRTVLNSLFCGPGSSRLHVSRTGEQWWAFLKPDQLVRGLLCEKCGSLTIEPTAASKVKILEHPLANP